MSSSAAAARAVARPAVRPGTGLRQRPTQPRLRVVAPARSGPRLGLALLSVALLAAGLIALLLLNINLSRGAYQLSDAQAEQRGLVEARQALREEIEAARAPQQLAERAQELGMVPAPNTAFIELPSGRLRGTPREAQAPPRHAADAGGQDGAAGDGARGDRSGATAEPSPARSGAARRP